jgi:hypothetical protein
VNQVEGLAKDRKTGVLVLATSNGLYQFNGYAFSPYRTHPGYSQTIFTELYSSKTFEHLLGINSIGELYHLAEEPQKLGTYLAVDIRETYFSTIDSLGTIRYIPDSETKEYQFQSGITQATFIHRLNPDTILLADQTNTYTFFPKSGKKELFFNEPILDVKLDASNKLKYFLTKKSLYEVTSGGLKRIDLQLSENQFLSSIFLTYLNLFCFGYDFCKIYFLPGDTSSICLNALTTSVTMR